MKIVNSIYYDLFISIISGLIASIISIIFTVNYTYEKQRENEINNSLEKTLKEIEYNYNKLSLPEILSEYDYIEKIAKNKKKEKNIKIWPAFRKECNPFSNISHLQYLVIEESSNFLTNYARLYPKEKRIKIEYINEIIEGFKEINSCLYCFEDGLYNELNNAIRSDKSDEYYKDIVKKYFDGFGCCFDEYIPNIEKYYSLLDSENKDDILFKRKYFRLLKREKKSKIRQYLNLFKNKKINMNENNPDPSSEGDKKFELLNSILEELKKINNNTKKNEQYVIIFSITSIIIAFAAFSLPILSSIKTVDQITLVNIFIIYGLVFCGVLALIIIIIYLYIREN